MCTELPLHFSHYLGFRVLFPQYPIFQNYRNEIWIHFFAIPNLFQRENLVERSWIILEGGKSGTDLVSIDLRSEEMKYQRSIFG